MLAEHLVTQQMCHISVVEGGWEAIEHLVAALGLELLPPSPQKEPKDGDKLDGPERVADDLQVPGSISAPTLQQLFLFLLLLYYLNICIYIYIKLYLQFQCSNDMINSKRILIPNYYCADSEVDEVTKVAGICPVLDNKSPQK